MSCKALHDLALCCPRGLIKFTVSSLGTGFSCPDYLCKPRAFKYRVLNNRLVSFKEFTITHRVVPIIYVKMLCTLLWFPFVTEGNFS